MGTNGFTQVCMQTASPKSRKGGAGLNARGEPAGMRIVENAVKKCDVSARTNHTEPSHPR